MIGKDASDHCHGGGLLRAGCKNSGDAGRSRAARRETGARKALPGAGLCAGQQYRPGDLVGPFDDARFRPAAIPRRSIPRARPTSWPSPPPCPRFAWRSMPDARLGRRAIETNLGPSMTIGTGFAGGSSLSDNLTPHHLMQYARIAYNKDVERGVRQFHRTRSPQLAAKPRSLLSPWRSAIRKPTNCAANCAESSWRS